MLCYFCRSNHFYFKCSIFSHIELLKKEERRRRNILQMDRIVMHARASVSIFILVIVRLNHSVH